MASLVSIAVPFLLAIVALLNIGAPSPIENSATLTKQQLQMEAEARVAQINKSQRKWTAKVHDHISEMSDAEFKQLLGLRRDPYEHAKRVAERRIVLGNSLAVKNTNPTTLLLSKTGALRNAQDDFFDARKQWPECADVMRKIQNQAYCGSCWAVSSASVMQDRICIQSGGKLKVDISAADLMSCVPLPSQGCNGGEPYQAFQYWFEHGVCTGSNYTLGQGCKPYPVPPDYPREHLFETPKCTRHCENRQYGKKYQKDQHFGHSIQKIMYNEEEDIMAAIRKGGPVVGGFAVYDDFRHYSSGVYEHGNDAVIVGAHAIRIIGWGYDEESELPYWLVANSWGTKWGFDGGYFKMARGQNECFIESWNVNYGDATLE